VEGGGGFKWAEGREAGGDLDACHMTPINRFNCSLTDAVTRALRSTSAGSLQRSMSA